MAKYIIEQGVSDQAQKSFETLLTTVKSISKELDGKNLSSLTKDAAQVEKIMLQNGKLQEQLKKAIADREAAEERAMANAIKREEIENKKAAKEKANADTWLNYQKRKYEEGFKQLQLEEEQFAQMLKQEQKENEIAAKAAQRAKEKQKNQKIIIDNRNYELEQMNAYYRALEKESDAAKKAANSANSKKSPLSPEARVANANTANLLKLNAIAADQNSTSLQKMYAQMKLLEIEMQSKFNPALTEQSEEFRKLNAQHAKLQQEYQRTSRATGVMGRSLNSTYGSTFQLTQVMRELPNFAIDARIGFMALSNNLPMLADSFKMLKQQIIDTEGAAGASRKTWAAFGKSLLSLNTIMIVASTLFVLFGDDIVNAIGKLFRGADAVDTMRESTKALIQVMQDYDGQAAKTIGSIQKMGVEIEKYGGDADYTKTIIDNFNTTFNTHLTRIDEVKKAYPEMAKAAIDAAVKLQASARIIDMGARGTLMSMEGEKNLSMKPSDAVVQQRKMFNELVKIAKNEKLDMNEVTTSLIKGENPFTYSVGMFAGSEDDNLRRIRAYYNDETNIWYAQQIAKIQKGKGLTKLAEKELAPLLTPPTVKTDDGGGGGGSDKVARDKAPDMKYLFPDSIVGEIAKIQIAPIGVFTPPVNELAKAIETNLNYAADAYKEGSINFQEYEAFKTQQLQIASDNNIKLTEETQKKLFELEAERQYNLRNLKRDEIDQAVELTRTLIDIWSEFYAQQNDLIDKQLEKDTKINDERLKQYEDEAEAGLHTEKELSDYKERNLAYQESLEEEARRKKAENDKKAFIAGQALALAEVWINYAMAQPLIIAASAAAGIPTFGAGTAPYLSLMEGLSLASAIASSALIAAQTIPAFEHGGITDKDGVILAGEKRHELAILPDGKMFITNNKPTLYDVPKGTEILPDLNKIDIMDILHLKPLYANHSEDKQLIREMQNVTRAIKTQKQGNFYGMPLIKQLDSRGRFDSRRKSLMN